MKTKKTMNPAVHSQESGDPFAAAEILEKSPAAMVVVDLRDGYQYANASAEEVLGVSGTALWDRISAADRAFFMSALSEGRTLRDHRLWITAKAGTKILLSLSAVPIGEAGSRRAVLSFSDITDQAWVEDALQLYMDRLAMLRGIDRAVLTVRPPEETARIALKDMHALVPYDFAVLYSINGGSDRFTSLVQCPGTDPRGEPSESREICDRAAFMEAIGTGEAVLIPDVGDPTDRRRLSVPCLHGSFACAIVVPLAVKDVLTGCLILAARLRNALKEEHAVIATEAGAGIALSMQNAALVSALEQEGRELAALAQRVELVQEGERRRLSRELHDSVGQSLTAIGIRLNILQSQLDPQGGNKALTEAFDEVQSHIGEVAEKIRGVICDLRPPILDDYGLYAALAWLCRKTVERFGLKMRIEGADISPRLPSDTELTLFRIAQEALANCIKHAGAGEAVVKLHGFDGGVELTIADDGRGFDASAPARASLPAAEAREHWGLAIMRERALSVGGSLTVDSSPGLGTVVRIRCPRVKP